MAQQTNTRSTRKPGDGRSKPRSSSSPNTRSTKSRSNSSRAQTRRRTQSKAGSTGRKRPRSSSNKGTVEKAKSASVKAADAGGATAKKLRIPALVAGAGVAGLAGGIAVARSRQRKVLGVPLPGRSTTKNLAGAAKNIGALAERAGHVAEQLRVAGEALGGNDVRRSPIEVVLEGLTRRSQPAKPD